MAKPKVVIIHNIVSPHVIPVFQELAKLVSLKVFFCAQAESNRSWAIKPTGFWYQILPHLKLELKGKDLFTLFFNPRIWSALKQSKPSLVIIGGWDLPTYYVAAAYCWWHHVPFIVWSGSTQYELSWRRTLSKPLVKVLIKAASGYLAYGLRARDYLISLGANPAKVHLAYNGVAIQKYISLTSSQRKIVTRLKRQLRVQKRVTILFYGQLIDRKRPQLLLSVFKKLSRKKLPISLLIIGKGPLKADLAEAIQKLPYKHEVHLIDDPGDEAMPAYYGVADVVVLPSYEEVWGLVVNQAMASGKPVIVSDRVGSASDLVIPNHTGLIFSADNVDELESHVMTLVKNSQLRKEMGRQARERVKRTSPEQVAMQMMTAISEVGHFHSQKTDPERIVLPTVHDDGLLTFGQSPLVPFPIGRVYYIYQSTGDLPRGFHAHKTNYQALFCLKGSVVIRLDDGEERRDITLHDPAEGVLLKPMMWHEMHSLTPDTILLVLASHRYDPTDYIRNYDEFMAAVQKKKFMTKL